MARSTALIFLLMLTGCQSTAEKRAEVAAQERGKTQAVSVFPDPPAACIAKIGRVRIGDEPWVVTFRRWEVVADIRDRQAEDCAAWFADIKQRWGNR